MKTLVAFFSASGVTAKLAQKLAHATGADLYEIAPEVPYTQDDLNWQNPQSRSSIEMKNKASRPALAAGTPPDPSRYDLIFLGFPIWWYIAPTIINTFLESMDFSGRTIVLFATSGGSGFGRAVENLQPSAPGATIREGSIFNGAVDEDALRTWAESFVK